MAAREIEVRRATAADLNLLVPLFDAYRQFYRQPSAPEQARRFLMERIEHSESAIFLAFDDAAAIGFTQPYPSFSSGAMARIFVLNDLFVAPEARRCDAGVRTASGSRSVWAGFRCGSACALDGDRLPAA